mgnify:FL=1
MVYEFVLIGNYSDEQTTREATVSTPTRSGWPTLPAPRATVPANTGIEFDWSTLNPTLEAFARGFGVLLLTTGAGYYPPRHAASSSPVESATTSGIVPLARRARK